MTPTQADLRPSRGIQDIAGRAMLVSVKIRQFSANKTDKKISKEVAAQHNADSSMGHYKKALIAKEALAELTRIAGEIRKEHGRRTLPWAEDGSRILTSTAYNQYAEFMRKSNEKWDDAVAAFLSQWDSFVEDARVKLNGMFNPNDYPEMHKLRGMFEFRWTVRPIPLDQDFRVALGSNEVAAIKAQLQDELDTTVKDAMRSVWEQMHEVVGKMVERLRAYNPAKPGEACFRDTLVTNISDLLQILPSLNLTNDPKIDEFTAKMQELVRYDAQALRDNMIVRDDIAARAEAILNGMAAFVA